MEEGLLELQQTRKRRINPDPKQWKKNQQKQLRLEGKEYVFINKEGEKKTKTERTLGPHCGCSRSGINSVRQCNLITEEDRLKVKGSFDKLSWEEKKLFVISHVNEVKESKFRRYHLYHAEQKIVVCLFIPRKDQCEFCYSYETGQVSKEKYDEHIQKKKDARSEMQKSYESSEEKGCFSMDVQATKTCPKSQLSSTFYKTKLQCHNFTIYNNKTRDCSSFWFTEIDSDSQASTYISFIFFFLIQYCVNIYKVIELFSDNCASQNKNIFLANALLYIAVKFNIAILQKFLTRGHTQMKVDSSHACIERKVDKEKIDVPQDYVDITSQARKDPKPYDVMKVDHTFFKDFRVKEGQFYKSLKPNAHEKVTDIVAIKYIPEGKIFTKTKFTKEWEPVPGPRLPIKTDFEYPSLNTKPLPISARKYRDLQDLKSTVDSKHHKFYDSLPHY
ncbi:hypothetical protein B566_EDAN010834 [Ephemera danica]|nr:hypothetical protein B566_EDAN010834 [Ephemera danica]